MVQMRRENRSKFITVKCPDCENEQLIEKINLDLLPNIRNHFNV